MTITNRKRDAVTPTHGGTAIKIQGVSPAPEDGKLVLLPTGSHTAEWVRLA